MTQQELLDLTVAEVKAGQHMTRTAQQLNVVTQEHIQAVIDWAKAKENLTRASITAFGAEVHQEAPKEIQ